jgi:hypothetical protein
VDLAKKNLEMLAQLQVLGIYLFPNSSSVSQEMDQLYSLFQSIVWKNLEILFDACLRASKSMLECLFLVACGQATMAQVK